MNIKKFNSYEINECGKWNPYYILDIDTCAYGTDDTCGYVNLKCLDIRNNMIVYRFINIKDVEQDNNIKPIKTNTKIHHHFLVQLHKLETL